MSLLHQESNQGVEGNSEGVREQAGGSPHNKVEGRIRNHETSDARSRPPSLILFSLGLMRGLSFIIFIVASLAFAEPTTRRPLTTAEAATLKDSVDLGHRVLAAWSRYSQVTSVSSPIPTGVALFTGTPTLELLHATHSLSDSDFTLSLRCQIKLHPVPVDAPNDAPILSVRTDRGELVFDITGNITLQPPR